MDDMELEPVDSRFFLNPYADEHFKHCPSCGDRTYPRNRALLVQIERDTVLPVSAKCRYCSHCDLLIAHLRDIEAELNAIADLDVAFGPDAQVAVLGILDRTQLRPDLMDVFNPTEILEAFRPVGNYVHYVLDEDAAGNPIWVEHDAPDPNVMDVPVPEIADVRSLGQLDETWELAVRQVDTWIMEDEDDTPFRPYITMVVSRSGPVVVFSEMTVGEPTQDSISDTLLKAMAFPVGGAGDARRPTRVVTDDDAIAEPLRFLMGGLDIDCSVGTVDEVNQALGELEHFLREEELPGLLKHPGVTPEQVGELFEAAADFYIEEMWDWMLEEDLIAIRYPTPDSPWRFVSIIGNAGWEYGIAVWETIADYTTAAAIVEPADAVGMLEYHALTFEEIHDMPTEDVAAQEYYNWPVVDPWAYPFPMIAARDAEMRRPGPEEIEWYTAALQALVDFSYEAWPEDEDEAKLEPLAMLATVLLGDREVEVELRFPAELALLPE
jgi:hypothetical protein